MNETDYIPDWYVGDTDEPKGLRNIKNIRKVTEETIERASY